MHSNKVLRLHRLGLEVILAPKSIEYSCFSAHCMRRNPTNRHLLDMKFAHLHLNACRSHKNITSMRSQPSLFYFELMAGKEDYEDTATGQHFDTDAARNGLAVFLVALNYPLESRSQPVFSWRCDCINPPIYLLGNMSCSIDSYSVLHSIL